MGAMETHISIAPIRGSNQHEGYRSTGLRPWLVSMPEAPAPLDLTYGGRP